MSIRVPNLAGFRKKPATRGVGEGLAPTVPSWIIERFKLSTPESPHQVSNGNGVALVTVTIPRAAALGTEEFEKSVRTAYESVITELKSLPSAMHPIRFWNHIPDIHRRAEDGRDRYMVFNAGRFAAFEKWYGGVEAFDRMVATASGIGWDGEDLIVHCLAAEVAGKAVGNPRQVQSFRYSKKYGPLPPCFARATLVGKGLVLVGGTASIRGEETLCEGDLNGQIKETIANLSAVMREAAGDENDDAARRRYREMRVYVPDERHAAEVEQRVRGAFVNVTRVEIVRAELCRKPLMVEIEGIGEIDG